MSVEDRGRCIELVQQARASGARRVASCEVLEVSLRTVERWEKDPDPGDQRRGPKSVCGHALSEKEKQAIVEVSNSQAYRDLSPWQMVARLADAGQYLGSESSFYRVLKQNQLLSHRQSSKPRVSRRPKDLLATPSQRGVELGHHVSEQPGARGLLLSVLGRRHFQPDDRGLDR